MKKVICCLLFALLAGYHTTAQKNIFFKKDKPKYPFIANKPATAKNKQQLVPLRMSLYTISTAVNRPFSFSMPKQYLSTSSKDDILFILGLAGSIAGSIYADKNHYHFPGSALNPSVNYWKTSH